MAIANINDGSNNPPRLALYYCYGALSELPDWSTGPSMDVPAAAMAAIGAAGYEGVQRGNAELARAAGLKTAWAGRIDSAEDADVLAKRTADGGHVCATLHAGRGLEDDATVDALVDGVINASVKHGVPLYIETHRATITQDVWRTVQITQRRPAVRFNGDFSHWYTGHELPYGDFDDKVAFFAPVLDRVRFMHGRIGDPGSMQVYVGENLEDARQRSYVQHFMKIWTAAMRGFLASARPGDILPFSPELLHPSSFYARAFRQTDGRVREESDRWRQSLLLCEIARACFAEAQSVGARAS